MLVLSRKKDERIAITLPDGRVGWLMVVEIRADKTRLGLDFPEDVRVDREEVHERRQCEVNRSA